MDFVECLPKRWKMSVSALENKCKGAKYVLLKVFNKFIVAFAKPKLVKILSNPANSLQ